MSRVAIIGAGIEGLSLIKALKGNKKIDVVGICDIDSAAPGLAEAQRRGIPTYDDHTKMLRASSSPDLIINVSSDPSLSSEIELAKDERTEVIHGSTAALVWELIAAQQSVMEKAQQRMLEMNDLYHLGLKLSSSADLQEVYAYVIQYATRLTGTPAGSIALLDEASGEMVLAHAEGFSENFGKFKRWKLRPGGLTSHILNQNVPEIIPDITKLEQSVNPALAAEGVKSIIAAPMTTRGKIVGILYVDDFTKRDFDSGEAAVLGLLSGYAALSIEKMKLLDDTRKMAVTDGLTGLKNQQEFLAQLDAETTRAARYGRQLSVVGLDIDFFKPYNDEFGHLAGNDVLRVLSQTLSDNSRKADMCARIGGEEFAIVMPETTLNEAALLAERLRVIIENMYNYNSEAMKRQVTVSIGVATFPGHGESSQDLYKSADDALYKAKEMGRNRVVVYPDVPVADLLDGSALKS